MTTESNSRSPSSEVFLSPRVVDREAFDDFAGVLRAIVDDAHALVGSIESGAGSAKKTLDELERSESAMRPKIDVAARVLASMDERIARIESLLTRAERAGESLENVESRVAGMIDERMRALESRIEDAIAGAEARLNTSAVETTTRVTEALRATEQSLDRAKTDTDAMHADAQNQLRELGDRLLGELTDAAAEGRELMRETLTRLERQVEPTRERIEATADQLEERLDRLHKRTLALMSPGVERLESLCERGEALLGCNPESMEREPGAPPEAGSLSDIVNRCERMREGADAAGVSAGEDQARTPDTLNEAIGAVKSDLSEELAKMTRAIETLVHGPAPAEESPAATIEPKPASRQPNASGETSLSPPTDLSRG